MKKILILILTVVAFHMTACSQKTIKGNGILSTENRRTSEYDKVTLIGSPDVELIEGIEGSLIVSGDSNIIPYIETNVVNNELIIRFKEQHNYNIKKPLKVVVPIKDVSEISVKGSGDIVGKDRFTLKNVNVIVNGSGDIALDLLSDSVNAEVFGSGDIKLKGNAKNFKANVKGSGDIKSKSLQAQVSDLRVNGSGDIESTTTNQVNATVSGSGDIKVYGSPLKVTKSVKGSGDIDIN